MKVAQVQFMLIIHQKKNQAYLSFTHSRMRAGEREKNVLMSKLEVMRFNSFTYIVL